MSNHDAYDKQILKALQDISKSIQSLEKTIRDVERARQQFITIYDSSDENEEFIKNVTNTN